MLHQTVAAGRAALEERIAKTGRPITVSRYVMVSGGSGRSDDVVSFAFGGSASSEPAVRHCRWRRTGRIGWSARWESGGSPFHLPVFRAIDLMFGRSARVCRSAKR